MPDDDYPERGPEEAQEEMSYRDYCEWFAIYGDPQQEAAESEFNAGFDDIRERFAGF